jgi:hypothetical protein
MNKLNTALTTGAVTVALLAGANVYAQDDSDITRYGPETFTADEFEVDGFAGTIEVIVEAREGIEISAFGPADKMERFEVDHQSDTVEVSYDEVRFRWNDWNTWLGWWRDTNFEPEDYPVVTVRLPTGTAVDVDGMTGGFNMGDLNGPLRFSGAGAIDGTIGDVRSADFDIAGAAELSFGDVAGPLSISVAGAADLSGGSASSVDISLRGASDIALGDIAGGVDISIAGAGDVEIASMNGDFDVSIAGSGDIEVGEGRAETFDVSIAGSGEVTFRGTAVNPSVSIAGMGDVFIERYEGNLSHSGMGDVNIGSGS